MKCLTDTSVSHRPLDVRLAQLSAARFGVFTRSDALREGATATIIQHRIEVGLWVRIHPGVYRLAGSQGSWRQSLTAAYLAAGPPVAASYRSAGCIWSLLEPGAFAVEVTVLRGRRLRLRGVVAHEVSFLDAVDGTTKDGIPVTTPTRTVIDLAGVLTEEALEEVLDDALRRGLTTVRRIRWRLERLGNRRGSVTLRRLLDARDPRVSAPKSHLETRVLRTLRKAGLPLPERQYPIRDRGRLVAIVDFAYPDIKLAIEADGYEWHSGRPRWERDLARRNAITGLGWRVLHVTSRSLEPDPGHLVEMVIAAQQEGHLSNQGGPAAVPH